MLLQTSYNRGQEYAFPKIQIKTEDNEQPGFIIFTLFLSCEIAIYSARYHISQITPKRFGHKMVSAFVTSIDLICF